MKKKLYDDTGYGIDGIMNVKTYKDLLSVLLADCIFRGSNCYSGTFSGNTYKNYPIKKVIEYDNVIEIIDYTGNYFIEKVKLDDWVTSKTGLYYRLDKIIDATLINMRSSSIHILHSYGRTQDTDLDVLEIFIELAELEHDVIYPLNYIICI